MAEVSTNLTSGGKRTRGDGIDGKGEEAVKVGALAIGGTATGVGSLPHRDAEAAAAFSLRYTPELPAIPSLPRRSPAEGMIAQAVVGIRGVGLGPYGSFTVDLDRIDPLAPVATDIGHDAFGGFRAFLALAAGRTAPVKWQLTGPVTLGLALMRAGVPASTAFDVAVRAVRSRVQALHAEVASALPAAPQVVVVDEPSIGEMMSPSFPLPPDVTIDIISGALAAVENYALAGVHCCADADWASVLASGPSVLSLPMSPSLADVAGYLSGFLERGGIIAWGVIPTDGPLSRSCDRPWRKLSALWCQLVQRGCDAARLRQQSLITPLCGLGMHAEQVAAGVFEQVGIVAYRVRTQALATRLNLGA